MDQFVAWLNGKLREFNTDEGIFGSYITGILEGDETSEEKTEALEGILAEIIVGAADRKATSPIVTHSALFHSRSNRNPTAAPSSQRFWTGGNSATRSSRPPRVRARS